MSDAAPLLDLRRVTKRFGGVTALNGISVSVPRGGITGIIGPNGAGKTTVFNVITGAYTPTSGEVVFDGQPVAGLKPHRIARRGIARTFQNIRLFSSMTVWEHLLVAQPHTGAWLGRLTPGAIADAGARRRADEVLAFFGLGDVRERTAGSLPYGVQRKVEMARALTTSPKLLLLDEPVAGMNQDEAEALRGLLHKLRATGLTILLIEHDMPFVMSLCEYLYVFDFGALIAQGEPAAVRSDPIVLDAYLGKDE
jgi:branched-chain amino acid transport system ATP-binding protein